MDGHLLLNCASCPVRYCRNESSLLGNEVLCHALIMLTRRSLHPFLLVSDIGIHSLLVIMLEVEWMVHTRSLQ